MSESQVTAAKREALDVLISLGLVGAATLPEPSMTQAAELIPKALFALGVPLEEIAAARERYAEKAKQTARLIVPPR